MWLYFMLVDLLYVHCTYRENGKKTIGSHQKTKLYLSRKYNLFSLIKHFSMCVYVADSDCATFSSCYEQKSSFFIIVLLSIERTWIYVQPNKWHKIKVHIKEIVIRKKQIEQRSYQSKTTWKKTQNRPEHQTTKRITGRKTRDEMRKSNNNQKKIKHSG